MQIDHLIRSKRKTIAIIVRLDGTLEVRAPMRASSRQITDLVKEKQAWIVEKQSLVRLRAAATPGNRFVDGEMYPYLGQDYPLKHVDVGKGLRFDGGFILPRSLLPRAAEVMKAWYVEQARRILNAKTGDLASRNGLVYSRIRIMSARTRWGSCSTYGSLNFNWRLVMAPPVVMEYVIIHELAHLRVRNHAREFWDYVGRMMPDYRIHRAWLKTNGQRYQEYLPNG